MSENKYPSCDAKVAEDLTNSGVDTRVNLVGWSDYDCSSSISIVRKSNTELFDDWFKNYLGDKLISDYVGRTMREVFLAAYEIKDKQKR